MKVGTPLQANAKRVLFLGSGELGKEVVIELMRLGIEVIACDRYADAPAMQVAHRCHVFDMLDAARLREIVTQEKPDLIVPEIEAIATAELKALESEGWHVIPTAEAAMLTMDREGIRRLAAEELSLPTAKYQFADTREQLDAAAEELGFPCVIKPIMSSSGKGQSVAKTAEDLDHAWEYSQSAGRAGAGRIIVEEFIQFDSEITLLTLRTKDDTLFVDPVGHRQVGGDYVESWQPHPMSEAQLTEAKHICKTVTDRLGGLGIFGMELFLLKDGRVLFSEVSPRPHDTGMVTMVTQQWSEFALHARAILGLPVRAIRRHAIGASAAIRAGEELKNPVFEGVADVFEEADVDLRLFGKPNARKNRRMAVALATGDNWEEALARARAAAAKVSVIEGD